MFAHCFNDHVFDAADDHFHEVLESAGDGSKSLCRQYGEKRQNDDDQPGIGDGISPGSRDMQGGKEFSEKLKKEYGVNHNDFSPLSDRDRKTETVVIVMTRTESPTRSPAMLMPNFIRATMMIPEIVSRKR